MFTPELKILFTGSMGAGKTTAIGAISEIEPITTEALNTTPDVNSKPTTTVGLDYGEITLDGGEKLRLYGTPGQRRFREMWRILSEGALGAVILVDHQNPESAKDLDVFLDAFAELIAETGAVVGVTHADILSPRSFVEYEDCLERRGLVIPLLLVDARRKDNVLSLLDALLSMLEARLADSATDADGVEILLDQ